MDKPFYQELVKQERLEQQYEILLSRGMEAKETAIHLARFAEAILYVRAERHLERMEKEMAQLRKQMAEAIAAAAGEPRWEDAPEWANWWAKDRSGGCFWYAHKPKEFNREGWLGGGRRELARMAGEGWDESLTERPPREGD